MTSDEIREAFLRFFEGRLHVRMPSASLVPVADPTLLLTSAGMVPFKRYFTGEITSPHPRLTSSQKCFRTTDIDEVGDRAHLTFFEMLGNFSIGDYFKRDAIMWAWEFVTHYLGLPDDRLWISVYLDDDEAFDHWNQDVGVPAERILRLGEEDNFWGPPGSEGPCGPCSEIHYDYGPEHGCGEPTCGTPACGCARFVELWNLVFMQFYQHLDGRREPLPAPNIDTGLGLERAAAILQGKESVYETDLFRPIVQRVENLAGKLYGDTPDVDYAIRVVAEHARSATFLIAEGMVPGNEGREYVLRRVIRRAIRFGKGLGLDGLFLGQVAEAVIQRMGEQYPELMEHRAFILKALSLEEERFAQVVQSGLDELDGYFAAVTSIPRQQFGELDALITRKMRQNDELTDIAFGGLAEPVIAAITHCVQLGTTNATNKSFGWQRGYARAKDDCRSSLLRLSSAIASTQLDTEENQKPIEADELRKSYSEFRDVVTRVPGRLVFELYDTYGFPPELTQEIARERGMEVDMERFGLEMEAQRERGRAAADFGGERDEAHVYASLNLSPTLFLGYTCIEADSVVIGLFRDGKVADHAQKGQKVQAVLKETPFYAEGGGQVGDTGTITGPMGCIRVENTQRPVGNLVVHYGYLEDGSIGVSENVRATVDSHRRGDTSSNHTATHMLHAALRQVLGLHVRQAGSLVTPDRLRFDFTHIGSISREDLCQVQCLVNEKVRQDVTVQHRESTYQSAVQNGALAFFGDQYGECVRVVEVSGSTPFSLEVCGGTHVARTGEVGYFHIVSDGSIGSGVRRIEAVTGRAAEQLIWERTGLLDRLAHRFKTTHTQLEQRIDALVQELNQAQKQAGASERELSREEASSIVSRVQKVDGVSVIADRTSASSVDSLRYMGDWLRDKLGSGIIVLGSVINGRPFVVTMVTKDLVARGIHAGNISREVAKEMGGGGGGRPDVAQAGGKYADRLEQALKSVPEVVRQLGGVS